MPMKNLGAIIVAAGMSSRMGEFKAIKELMGRPIILHMIETFKKAGVSKMIVVTGNCGEQLEALLQEEKMVQTVRNENFAVSDMFTSAKLGMQAIKGKCERFFFTPVDSPAFSIETLEELLSVQEVVVKPMHKGRGGHPLLLDEALIEDLLAYKGAGGMKGALKVHPFIAISVEDEGILFNTNTPEEFEKMRLYLEKRAYILNSKGLIG